jgi:hypothetical protein
LAVTNLKTKKPARSTNPPPSILLAAPAPSTFDYRELAQLAAMLDIYFIILCISELLSFFANKD